MEKNKLKNEIIRVNDLTDIKIIYKLKASIELLNISPTAPNFSENMEIIKLAEIKNII